MTSQLPIRARSWLFTPATRPDRFAKAAAAGADVAILDLEDAVAPKDKAEVRKTAVEYLAGSPVDGVLHALRINGLDTLAGISDLDALLRSSAAPDFLVLPKTVQMLRRCARDPIQRSPHFRQIGPARVGQLNAAVLPPEQRRPEPVFEQLDMPADRSMRDVKLVRGTTEAAEPGRSLEGSYRIEGRQAALHVKFPNRSRERIPRGDAVYRSRSREDPSK
jgi:hypothetical protein